MKKKVFKVCLVTLIVFSITIAGTGCGLLKGASKTTTTTDKSKASTVVTKSKDGKESITTPASWKEDNELNTIALLQVSKRAQEKYTMVIGEGKDSFSKDMKLSDYTKAAKSNMVKAATNGVATDTKDVTANGNKAQYFELSGEVQKIKVTYMVEVVESADKFYQIIGWTLTPQFDANKAEIKEVMDSFKVVK